MLLPALHLFWRGMLRRRLFTALNLVGMALGIATFLTLALIVRYEFTFDRWIPDARDIYRIDAFSVNEAPVSSILLADAITAEHPAWAVAPVSRGLSSATAIINGQAREVTLERINAAFPDVFQLPLLAGNAMTAFAAPDAVVMTRHRALSFFGTDHDILGRTVDIIQQGRRFHLHVTAVLRDLPPNTTPQIDLLLPSPAPILHRFSTWNMGDTEVWLRVRPDTARQLPRLLSGIVARHATGLSARNAQNFKIRIRPLTHVHFFDATIGWGGMDIRLPIILGVVGTLALAAGLVNFVTLSTAIATTRARDVAMRKVLGATPFRLGLSYIVEAIGMVLIATCLALVVTELTLPWIATLSGWPITLDFGFALPLLLLTASVGGCLSGLYPSWLLARFRPAAVLASSKLPGTGRGANRLREGLVTVQFAFAVILSLCALVMWRQTHLLQTMDRGFTEKGLLVASLPDEPPMRQRQSALLAAIKGVPGVTDAVIADDAPGGGAVSISYEATRPGGKNAVYLTIVASGPDALDALGARRLTGRLLDPHNRRDFQPMSVTPFDATVSDQDVSFGNHSVVLNTAAVQALGFASPEEAVGQSFYLQKKNVQTIIGVVANMRLKDGRSAVKPTLYYGVSGPLGHGVLTVHYGNAPEHAVREAIGALWKQFLPERAMTLQGSTEIIDSDIRLDRQRSLLMMIASCLTLSISCIGLYGIAVFNVQRRLFEIGVRKVLGATIGQVTRLLILQFLRPVLLANLIAFPAAWWLVRLWLSGFDRRIALSPLYFLATALIVTTLAIVTTFLQVRHGARSAPAVALGSS